MRQARREDNAGPRGPCNFRDPIFARTSACRRKLATRRGWEWCLGAVQLFFTSAKTWQTTSGWIFRDFFRRGMGSEKFWDISARADSGYGHSCKCASFATVRISEFVKVFRTQCVSYDELKIPKNLPSRSNKLQIFIYRRNTWKIILTVSQSKYRPRESRVLIPLLRIFPINRPRFHYTVDASKREHAFEATLTRIIGH